MKQIIIVGLLVIGIIGGAVVLSGDSNDVSGEPSNFFYGKEDAEVVFTEFADFECPACASFFPTIDTVKEAFKDSVRFEFVNFPLVQIHQNAIAAHRAGVAAGNQGKFWEMHDLLYQNQEAWNGPSANDSVGVSASRANELFEQYANSLELDTEKFLIDLKAPETIGVINADIAKGKQFGIESTPSFQLNGENIEQINQLVTVEGLTAFLQNALEEADQSDNSAESLPENPGTPEETPEARPEEE